MLRLVYTLSLLQGSTAAPPEYMLREVRSCGKCGVEATRGKRLGQADGAGSFSAHVRDTRRGESGRYFVSQYSWSGGELFVFDSSGRFERRVTREGAGPGESRGLGVFALGPRDTVYMADMANGRINVFDPSLNFRRSVASLPAARAQSLLILPGSVIVNASIPTSDRIGYMLHVFTGTMELQHSMSLEPTGFRPDRERKGLRIMTRARQGGFWAVDHGAYRIARYDSAGAHVETLLRNVDWFAAHDVAPPRTLEPAKPLIYGLREDSLGRLWVLITVSDRKNWRRAILPAGTKLPNGGTSPLPVIVDNDTYLDTVIEIIDPVARTVMPAARLDQAMYFFVGPRELAAEEFDQDGRIFVRLWTIAQRP